MSAFRLPICQSVLMRVPFCSGSQRIVIHCCTLCIDLSVAVGIPLLDYTNYENGNVLGRTAHPYWLQAIVMHKTMQKTASINQTNEKPVSHRNPFIPAKTSLISFLARKNILQTHFSHNYKFQHWPSNNSIDPSANTFFKVEQPEIWCPPNWQ